MDDAIFLKINNGTITLIEDEEERLEIVKNIKLNELRNVIFGLLSQTDYIGIKLYTMKYEGFTDNEIEIEKSKYSNIFEYRRKIRMVNEDMEYIILNETDINKLRYMNIQEEVNKRLKN